MTILLPIPTPKKPYEAYYIPYNIQDNYINNSFKIEMRQSDSIRSYREITEDTLKLPKGSFAFTHVYNNQITTMLRASNTFEDISENGIILLYEIDPALNP